MEAAYWSETSANQALNFGWILLSLCSDSIPIWRQHIASTPYYRPTRLHGVTFHKTWAPLWGSQTRTMTYACIVPLCPRWGPIRYVACCRLQSQCRRVQTLVLSGGGARRRVLAISAGNVSGKRGFRSRHVYSHKSTPWSQERKC
jgi:hypothetical protein